MGFVTMKRMLTVSRGRQFLQYVLPGILKPLRVLWNQIIGFFFAVFAILAAFRTYRIVQEYKDDAESVARLALSGAFALVMGFFGAYSFWRARKVSRS